MENTQTEQTNHYVQPKLYLSRDKQYLVIVMGDTFCRKHVNYFKQILGVPYEKKVSLVPLEGEDRVE